MKGPSVREYEARLGQSDVFRGLDAGAAREAARHAVLRPLRKRQVLWKRGSHAYELAYVWSGRLDVMRAAEGNVTYRSVPQNEIVGFSNAMGRTPCTVDIVAGEATQVLLIPGDVLRGLVPRYPDIAFRALDLLGVLLGQLSDEVELLHTPSLAPRLLARLRTLSRNESEIALTHAELASQVACRRESVTRALAALEEKGAIVCKRGRIVIVDLARA